MLPQIIVNGASAGLTYALVALAVTLIFGLARVVHFAVADFAMTTSFIIAAVQLASGNWLLSIGSGLLFAAVLSVIADRAVFRFTANKPIMGFLASLGFIMILRASVAEFFGTGGQTSLAPLHGAVEILGIQLRLQVMLNAGLIVAAMAIVVAVLEFTRFGLALKAVADNPLGASLMGVPVRRMVSAAFIITGLLVALVGWVMLTSGAIETTTANAYLLKGFAAALIGGLGNLYGAIVAGLAVGLIESISIAYGPVGWSTAVIFGAVIIILLIRPEGLWKGSSAASEVHA